VKALSVLPLSVALLAATMLCIGCSDGTLRQRREAPAGEPGDGGSGGSHDPELQCNKTETECGAVCCPNGTHVCNGGVCEPKAETCEYGATCATGKVCNSAGECQDGCFINNTLYPRGAENPSNQCESCEADSTTSWTQSAAEGAACGGDKFCNAAHECVAGCKIGGHVYEIGQRSPSGKCEVCSVANSTAWSQAASGDLCSDGGTVCRFDGKCVIALSVAAGTDHTCGVTPAGRAMCWGRNSVGQLGNGASADSTTPVGVSGLESGVVGIAVGERHSCALLASGEVMCWGLNDRGQLGVGSTGGPYGTPQLVAELPLEAVNITARYRHICAVMVDGTAMCWGGNECRELGGVASLTSSSPVQVVGLPSAVASITVGSYHTCAILEDSALWCWGCNGFGQLGRGFDGYPLPPLQPKNLANDTVSVVGGDRHTCAVSSDGAVRCWGRNEYGECGQPAGGNILEPGAPVAGLPLDVVGITAGYDFSCAWTASGRAICWGANYNGQLGDNKTASRHTPGFVYGLSSGVSAISAIAGRHACAIMQSGKVRCWGRNASGQIGDGSSGDPHLIPTELTLFP